MPLYAGSGSIFGWLTFTNGGYIVGPVDWFKKAQPGASDVDPSPFVGTWLNTNDESRQRIARVILTVRDGALIIHAFGDCAPELCDLGEVAAEVFADSVNAHTAMSFSAV